MNKRVENTIVAIGALFVIVFGLSLINSYFGWYGYEMWKERMGTFGDKTESVRRNVYVRDLKYESNIQLSNFNPYIEKGYWCGVHSLSATRFNKTGYPFQITLRTSDTIANVEFKIINSDLFDSIENRPLLPIIYLKRSVLEDTIILKIMKFEKSHDSIGYIKIWDRYHK